MSEEGLGIEYIIMMSVFSCIFVTPLVLYIRANRSRWIKEWTLMIFGDPEVHLAKKIEVQPKSRAERAGKVAKEKVARKVNPVHSPKGPKGGKPPVDWSAPRSAVTQTHLIQGPPVKFVSQTPTGPPGAERKRKARVNPKANPSKSSFLKEREAKRKKLKRIK